MQEIVISLVIVVLVCVFLWWLGVKVAGKAPPFGLALQILAVAGGVLWLLFNVREIITAIASI